MNKIISVGIVAACTAFVGFADTVDPTLPPGLVLEKLTPEQAAAREMRFQKRTGGYILNMKAMKGNVQFVNSQKIVPASALERPIEQMKSLFMCDFRCVERKQQPSVRSALEDRRAIGANVAVFLVDEEGLPAMLTAPEELWAFVNVRALVRDGKEGPEVETRVRREMWRALCFLLATDSMADQCLMRPIFSLSDIDNIGLDCISQEPYMKIPPRLEAVGVKPYRRTYYREACREGWAPEPTNEFQKAIWDRVHSAPTKPIVIEPEKTKQK